MDNKKMEWLTTKTITVHYYQFVLWHRGNQFYRRDFWSKSCHLARCGAASTTWRAALSASGSCGIYGVGKKCHLDSKNKFVFKKDLFLQINTDS